MIDPDLGVVEGNLDAKHTGDRCPHLVGEQPGEYSCAIHEHENYKLTPCYQFGQIEIRETDKCRIGVWQLANKTL